jgi:hypothetical protein
VTAVVNWVLGHPVLAQLDNQHFSSAAVIGHKEPQEDYPGLLLQ